MTGSDGSLTLFLCHPLSQLLPTVHKKGAPVPYLLGGGPRLVEAAEEDIVLGPALGAVPRFIQAAEREGKNAGALHTSRVPGGSTT